MTWKLLYGVWGSGGFSKQGASENPNTVVSRDYDGIMVVPIRDF